MNTKTLVSIAVVAILIGAGIYFFKSTSKPSMTSTPVDTSDPYMQALEVDKAIVKEALSKGQFDDKKVYGAMIRLAEIKWPEALELALELKDSESNFLREGAAQTLGYYPDSKADKALAQLLEDKNPAVRQHAFRAIGKVNSPERTALLQKAGASIKGATLENLAFLESEFRMATDQSRKEASLNKILELARGSDPDVALAASTKLIELAPQWDNTIHLIRSKVEENKNPGLSAAGIRYLAGRRDPWLKSRWNLLSKSPQPAIRKAVIQSLHRSCPPDRENILMGIAKSENDPTVMEVIVDEAHLLAEPWTQKILETVKGKTQDPLLQKKLSTETQGRPICAGLEKETKTQ